MVNSKRKIIENSTYPVLTKLIIETITKIEDENRLGTYKRFTTASNRKSWRKILPVVNQTIEEVLHLVIGTSYDNLNDKSLQNQIRAYYQSVRMV
jgi:hypothetical protein|tara:strand:+ start:617 stop:901 length:285 start_codon:yes stop_codon:yes gene_type:complete